MEAPGRILVGGTSSGCGKTTVTCALLSALKMSGHTPSAFKCGPDYIDPMFHREITGIRACSLDSFFCSDDTVNSLLYEYGRGSDISVIEGVMGFYDGEKRGASSDMLSRITDTPAILVVDGRSVNESAGAIIKGFLEYREGNRIRGVIFNRLSPSRAGAMEGLCSELGTRYLGCLPKAGFTLGSRHLGLITASEVENLRDKLRVLGELALKHIRMESILEIASSAGPPSGNASEPDLPIMPCKKYAGFPYGLRPAGPDTKKPVIAVARDSAFCFIYQENLDLLSKLGLDIRYFSPINDAGLPEGCCGIIICGGYPENHADELSANVSMRRSISDAVSSGMPCIAECGGFMYMHKTMVLEDGRRLGMAGVIDGETYNTGKLQRFGYASLTALTDGLIAEKGSAIRIHEFHYWDSTSPGEDFQASRPDGRTWRCGYNTANLYAGFPHLYFYADPRIALRFAKKCRIYMEEKVRHA